MDTKITACWRNDCQETCCFWSRGAPGPWGVHSCAGGPTSSLPFHVFLVAASNVKATSLCFCMPKSAHNAKEMFFVPFFQSVPVSIKALHNCRSNNSAQNAVWIGKSTVKNRLTWLLISFAAELWFLGPSVFSPLPEQTGLCDFQMCFTTYPMQRVWKLGWGIFFRDILKVLPEKAGWSHPANENPLNSCLHSS